MNKLLLLGIPAAGLGALVTWGLVDLALQRRRWQR